MNQAQEGLLELLIPGRHAAELLELAQQPLHPVALPIPLRQKAPRVRTVPLVRDVREDVAVDARPPLAVAVEPLVADQLVEHRYALDGPIQHRLQQRGVVRLAGDHVDDYGRGLIGRCHDYLAAKAAPAAAQALRLRAPLLRRAPPAC